MTDELDLGFSRFGISDLGFNKEPEPTIMTKATNKQRVLVFQQNGSGQAKIAGLRKYGGEALSCIGLQTQYFCAADPAGWDPIYGESPVHRAAEIHRKALLRALK